LWRNYINKNVCAGEVCTIARNSRAVFGVTCKWSREIMGTAVTWIYVETWI